MRLWGLCEGICLQGLFAGPWVRFMMVAGLWGAMSRLPASSPSTTPLNSPQSRPPPPR